MMDLLEVLSGRKKILSFEIIFDEKNQVGVNIEKNVAIIPTADYIRLWACYEAKIIYNLGYPKNFSANMAVGAIAKVIETEIDEKTDCFKKTNLDDVIQYSTEISKIHTKFTGEFYAKGSLERNIKTWFPLNITDQMVVYSTLALMQYAILMNLEDRECLDVLTKTATNMINLYESGMGVGIASVVQVPTIAYMQAIGIA
ncbi:hypothetical protein ACFL5H_01385 [Candidatus Latescibacterota bacterium]